MKKRTHRKFLTLPRPAISLLQETELEYNTQWLYIHWLSADYPLTYLDTLCHTSVCTEQTEPGGKKQYVYGRCCHWISAAIHVILAYFLGGFVNAVKQMSSCHASFLPHRFHSVIHVNRAFGANCLSYWQRF